MVYNDCRPVICFLILRFYIAKPVVPSKIRLITISSNPLITDPSKVWADCEAMRRIPGCFEAESDFSVEEEGLLHRRVLDTIPSQSHDETSSSHGSHDHAAVLDMTSSSGGCGTRCGSTGLCAGDSVGGGENGSSGSNNSRSSRGCS